MDLPKPLTTRRPAINVFRALTMLLMIFVNDVSSVSHVPAWIEHAAGEDDAMGFADTIFPAFLFIVGLSLPFAINNRIHKGKSAISIAGYILLRSLALIVMGFLHVNLENYSSAALLPHAVWTIAITLGFFLIWLDYPVTMKKSIKYTLTSVGIILLIVMALLFKGGTPEAREGLKPYWWGILGLIGWAYLVCALIYLLVKGNFYLLIVALLLFIGINTGIHTKSFHINLWVIGDASCEVLVMAGVIMGLLYNRFSLRRNYKLIWIVFTITGVLMIAAGFLIRPYAAGISKIRSTPAWIFICIGISILVFEMITWLTDKQGKENWFKIIRPAGTSTLTCYLLPYFLYSIYTLVHFDYPHFFNEGIGGIIRSFVVAFVLIIVGGVLERKHVRLQI